MDNLEHRAVIKFFVKKGLTPIEIFTEMKNVLDDNAPSYTTVKKWAAEFKHGHTSLQDNSRSGRPKTATTEEIMIKVHNIVLQDRRLKVSEIARDVGISDERVHHILTKELGMKKLFIKKKIIFHQDNARPHTSGLTMAKIAEFKFNLLPQPAYSPDLAPSDFHLFPKLKKFLRGCRFSSDDELIAAVNVYFEDLQEKDFRDGITGLEHRWMNCIEVQGDYVEK
ncbi:Histone-lysine N-methyltransferase SETMAR [Habropoda laboriosa]|uniref:Histone-lysine N-methyltransferase SETMAR n=1 Tax=Habropoda laboriosa TaxID=597456 RepID=A0A0L7QRS8_9HYME|nr:Histone-lysine N-methyltransferase SETMAR [Habropoda laboriosa]